MGAFVAWVPLCGIYVAAPDSCRHLDEKRPHPPHGPNTREVLGIYVGAEHCISGQGGAEC